MASSVLCSFGLLRLIGIHCSGGLQSSPTNVHVPVFVPFKLSVVPSCVYCGAKRLQYEPPNFCCCRGTIKLVSNDMPSPLKELFSGEHELSNQFRTYVRTYNNTFAFTSIGIYNYDKQLCCQNKGIYTFKVQGQIYHYINSLLPRGAAAKNLQLYFFDTEDELTARISSVERLDRDVVSVLHSVLLSNPYAQFFRSLRGVSGLDDLSIVINSNPSLDQKVFNAPSVSQVAAIWIENTYDPIEGNRNIRVFSNSGQTHYIQYYYGCYDALQYPLLFPRGEVGWHQGIPKCPRATTSQVNHQCYEIPLNFHACSSVDDLICREDIQFAEGGKRQTVSCKEYYAYKFQIRADDFSMVLSSGRLFQQFIVDVYIKLETQRLDYFRTKQDTSRSESYQGLVDSVSAGYVYGESIGHRVILPSSFIGGPRDMRKRYMDAMSLVQTFGKPDIFLTITCNPNWPEIKELLSYSDQPQDRPDLVARVFRAKLEELKNDIIKKRFFGHVAAHVYVIEFQKRGLPHAHFLVILKQGCKMLTPQDCDKYICAELPDPRDNPILYSLVKKHMMHGPCGILDDKSPCMAIKKNEQNFPQCKSRYPRDFSSDTIFPEEDTYPTYRRRDSGITVHVRRATLDNRWVVPYNPTLLLKYDCHINVEFCATIYSVKYLYKYVYKGHDRVSVALDDVASPNSVDEIKNFQNARWVSPPEAAWRIFGFHMNEMKPAVIQLQVHMPNHHYVNFYGSSKLATLININSFSETMLTEFFVMNSSDPIAKLRQLKYVEFPQFFVWNATQKKWTLRKKDVVIGRLVYVSPTEGERYYLRLLLMNVKGPTSYQHLKTVDGHCTDTFREAAELLGLCSSLLMVKECLDEAILFQMPSSLRRLFATILIFCDVSNPRQLWSDYKCYMCEDLAKSAMYTQSEMEGRVLDMLDDILDSMGKNIIDYNLVDHRVPNSSASKQARELQAEYDLNPIEADLLTVDSLNHNQAQAFLAIMEAVVSQKPRVFFIDGPGGSGKTFLYRALLANVRAKKWIALATASSGIAASLLPGGRTAHSRFKLPIDTDTNHLCNTGKQSAHSQLLRESRLIIWDEASMANRKSIEALDTSLRDIMDSNQLFGGKVIVFGGDFRQTLPVIRHAQRHQIIDASLVCSSRIWPAVKRFTLVQNMRAGNDLAFSEYLMRIGNGTEENIYGTKVKIPRHFLLTGHDEHALMTTLFEAVFPDFSVFNANPAMIVSRAILTPKNETVGELNRQLLQKFPGEEKIYLSTDRAIDSKHMHCEDYLNTFSPAGLPPHELILKKNCPLMLLRNLNPTEGLCNGTRLICHGFGNHVISCEIAVGDHKGKHVLIPKIPLQTTNDDDCPIPFKRTQFPVRLCFAMTINKSQGQTLDFVGVYLNQPVFTHGQLYVAMSRVRSAESLKVVICEQSNLTDNVVFKEVLEAVHM